MVTVCYFFPIYLENRDHTLPNVVDGGYTTPKRGRRLSRDRPTLAFLERVIEVLIDQCL